MREPGQQRAHPHRRSPRSRGGRVALAAGAALAAAAVLVPAVSATTSATATAPSTKRLHDDFNGDGYPDLAIGAPGTPLGSTAKAGAVGVLYGSAGGLSTSRKQVLTWSGRTNEEDGKTGYGSDLQSADLDEDGYADLLSSVAWRHAVDGYCGRTVVVNWGGPKGLSGTPQLLVGMPDAMHLRSFAVADVDGDRHLDLIRLGVDATSTDPDGEYGSESATADGAVVHGPFERGSYGNRTTYFSVDPRNDLNANSVAAGDVNGDGVGDIAVRTSSPDEPDSRGTVLLTGGAGGFTSEGGLKDAAGRPIGGEGVVIGDLNRDGYGDIVVGHSFDGFDSDAELPTRGGALGVVYGGPGGVSTTRKPVWVNQDTSGVPGAGEYGDGMGSALSIGDTDGDGYQDVATGLPGEDLGGVTDAGSVLVLRGSANGLTGTGAKAFSQDTAGVPGAAEKADRFGAETALGDTDGDRKDSLAVGDPAENAGNGAAWVFSATSSGTSATGSFSFGPVTMGLPATGARFGASLND
ncbi:VCBS repeat-containing protein [Streptomyces sp. NPDC005526]|uniref:VCBS repeat-containing protein n=1 Tax=Streptomyces sp. NPDC005526 TaxID=3156885 RepID=UPI0033A36DBB